MSFCLFILKQSYSSGTWEEHKSKPSPVTLSSAIPHESSVFRVNPMTKLSTTAVCCTALLSTLSYHASMHVSVDHSVFSAQFILVGPRLSCAGRPILRWVFWPLFTVGRFTEHERSFNTLSVIEIHTREHPTTHTDLQSDTQQLHSGSRGLRCLAKRHCDGSSSRAQYQLLKADFWGGGFEHLNL